MESEGNEERRKKEEGRGRERGNRVDVPLVVLLAVSYSKLCYGTIPSHCMVWYGIDGVCLPHAMVFVYFVVSFAQVLTAKVHDIFPLFQYMPRCFLQL